MEFRSKLPAELGQRVSGAAAEWQDGRTERLWARDASLWTGRDEAKWLGWLDIVERQQKEIGAYRALADDIRNGGFEYALLLGMGGSSLCPEVLTMTFGRQTGFPHLSILDSTDPAQVRTALQSVDLGRTIVIVSSKSGSTLEPNILKQFFMAKMREAVGDAAGKHFIAVTDPGSHMEQVAKADGFRHIFYGDPQIGGRYSALSNFGLVPAAIMGLDVEKLMGNARAAVDLAHGKDVKKNPGVELGLILGSGANMGRDKITIFTSPRICDLGAWLEQLIAESTGKQGKGITPVDREALAAPECYGEDRMFAYVRLEGDDNARLDAGVERLEKAGQPVVRFGIRDAYDIAAQFFTWEIATAVAGSVIGIDAFNQPDVEAAKVEARRLTDAYEETGSLPAEQPIFDDGKIRFYADARYAAELGVEGDENRSAAGILRAHFARIHAGDYFAVLGFLQRDRQHEEAMQKLRLRVRDTKRVATCLGFGPRFLHSTGQDYKGGPNTGVFLQITADHGEDLAIPGQKYSFGVVIDAQAQGDLSVLQQRRRRALRAHLGADVEAGLAALNAAVESALA